MILFALIAALALEQVRPLDVRVFVLSPLRRYASFFDSRFNDGRARSGVIAWSLAAMGPAALAWAAHAALYMLQPLFAYLFDAGVLYLTMGFRQFSHFFNDIHLALRMGELDRARSLLGEWRGRSAEQASSGEVARLAIEEALVHSHRYVFAVILAYVLLPGPSGPLLYRIAALLEREWGAAGRPDSGEFGDFAGRAFAVIDWLPQRFTAACFAVVGDFEDALYCWRTQAVRWPDSGSGILLASGAGALGVRLGMPVFEAGDVTGRPELGLGDEADTDFMQSAIGLVWRTLVLCMLLLTLIGVANWVGR